jgi:hypothetical protein
MSTITYTLPQLTNFINNLTTRVNNIDGLFLPHSSQGAIPLLTSQYLGLKTDLSQVTSNLECQLFKITNSLPILNPTCVSHTGTPVLTTSTGAGTSPTFSLQTGSTDEGGYINLTTGSSPVASALILTLTFNVPYVTIPKVIISPANAATAALSGTSQVYTPLPGVTSFIIHSSSVALSASTVYSWVYRVSQ